MQSNAPLKQGSLFPSSPLLSSLLLCCVFALASPDARRRRTGALARGSRSAPWRSGGCTSCPWAASPFPLVRPPPLLLCAAAALARAGIMRPCGRCMARRRSLRSSGAGKAPKTARNEEKEAALKFFSLSLSLSPFSLLRNAFLLFPPSSPACCPCSLPPAAPCPPAALASLCLYRSEAQRHSLAHSLLPSRPRLATDRPTDRQLRRAPPLCLARPPPPCAPLSAAWRYENRWPPRAALPAACPLLSLVPGFTTAADGALFSLSPLSPPVSRARPGRASNTPCAARCPPPLHSPAASAARLPCCQRRTVASLFANPSPPTSDVSLRQVRHLRVCRGEQQ